MDDQRRMSSDARTATWVPVSAPVAALDRSGRHTFGAGLMEAPLAGLRLVAFLLWPVIPILVLVGYVPAHVVLSAIGLAPTSASLAILAFGLGLALVGIVVRAIVGRLASRRQAS